MKTKESYYKREMEQNRNSFKGIKDTKVTSVELNGYGGVNAYGYHVDITYENGVEIHQSIPEYKFKQAGVIKRCGAMNKVGKFLKTVDGLLFVEKYAHNLREVKYKDSLETYIRRMICSMSINESETAISIIEGIVEKGE